MAFISLVSGTAAYLHFKLSRSTSLPTAETPSLPAGAENWLQELPVRSDTEYKYRLHILFHTHKSRYQHTLEKATPELGSDIQQLLTFLKPDFRDGVGKNVPGSWSTVPAHPNAKREPDLFRHVQGQTLAAVLLTEAQELANWKCLKKGLDLAAMLKWLREASIGQYFPPPQLSVVLPYLPSRSVSSTSTATTSGHTRAKTWNSSTTALDASGDGFYTSLVTLRHHRKLQTSEFLLRLDSLVAVYRHVEEEALAGSEGRSQAAVDRHRSETCKNVSELLHMKEKVQKMARQARIRVLSDPQDTDQGTDVTVRSRDRRLQVPTSLTAPATIGHSRSMPSVRVPNSQDPLPNDPDNIFSDSTSSATPSPTDSDAPSTITQTTTSSALDGPLFPSLPSASTPYFTAVHTLRSLYTHLLSRNLALPPLLVREFLEEERVHLSSWYGERFGEGGSEGKAVAEDEGDRLTREAPSEWVRGWLDK